MATSDEYRLIPLKAKYTSRRRPTPKSVKNQSSGNGKRERKGRIDWTKGTGMGKK